MSHNLLPTTSSSSHVPHFGYPCPDYRTMTSLHDADCRFERTPWVEVGRAYVGIVSVPAGGLCDGEALRHEMPGE